jgi:hypothetical protein
MFTKHHPNGDGSHHFNNTRLESLIASYQAGTDPTALGAIVELTQRRALTLIRFNGTTKYCAESELLSDINCKLLKAVDRFDPNRGSGFTFLSCLIQNTLRSNVTSARKAAARRVELDESVMSKLVTDGESKAQEANEDLTDRTRRSVRTSLTDERELAAQRWLIDSFLIDGFSSRRHQCADACMAVHGISHDRSRELFDLSMLEVRRILYDTLGAKQKVVPGQLLGTRCAWMANYKPLLSESEFTKFFYLMKGLAPYLLMIIDPAFTSHRTDRYPAVGRRNLGYILHGHPDAVPLFENGE